MSIPSVSIKSILFSDGSKIELSKNDIVVLVGPNNCGKSVALMNVYNKASNSVNPGLVIKEIELAKEGSDEELITWIKQVSTIESENTLDPIYSRMGGRASENQLKSSWNNIQNGLGSLFPFFVYHLSTESRLQAANAATNIPQKDPPSHPIHYLLYDDDIEKLVSSYFKQAFGQDLIVHRNAGGSVPLHCGDRPVPKEGEDRVSKNYLKDVEKLVTLHTQGDGMRSFVGVLLHSLIVDHSTILIDEPEAFLHPPQARLIGKMLVAEAPESRQLFVATHSGDLIRGLLDASSTRVRIIRIQRDENINYVKQLDNSGIEEIWGDPLLRHSNILDGLFHEKVIVCESDSDCRFYSSVMDAIFENTDNISKPDFMFTHCGGKDRIPIVLHALRRLGVPVKVITDFDVLNNESLLKELYSILLGDWDQVKTYWVTVRNSIESKKTENSAKEIIKEITNVLEDIEENVFPTNEKTKIIEIMKKSSPWSIAKTLGKNYVPNGEPTQAYNNLVNEFKKRGLFIVEVGELERFVKSVGQHGTKWVNKVLEKDLANDNELSTARDFVNEIVSSN